MKLERDLKRYVRRIRPGLIGSASNPNTNLNSVIEELRLMSPPTLSDFQQQLEDFLLTRDFVPALTEAGLTMESGAFAEIVRRLEYKILPRPVESDDILSFLTSIFDAPSDSDWLEDINRESIQELFRQLLPNRENLVNNLAPQFFVSLEILSVRLAGLGYDPVVTGRLRERRDLQNSFMDVTRHVHALLDGKGDAALTAIRSCLDRCHEAVSWIRSRRGVDGASLALSYRLLKIQQILRRMELLLAMIDAVLGEWRAEPAMDLFFEILLAELSRFNLRRFLGQNLAMLAFQITEHTGKKGEHYITRTRSEWLALLRSAAIGGAIVGVLAVLKFLVSHLIWAPAPEAVAYGLLYAGGFVWIQTWGGTLATKQPAMTASALASALDQASNSVQAMQNLCEVIVRTVRSQLIALLGNFMVSFPVAILVCLPFQAMRLPLIDSTKALSILESLHPYRSLSFFYAAVAGVGLFAAGLVAGYADNWFIFNHVGARLKNSVLLRNWVGVHNLDRAILLIDNNLGFWTGNIFLGFYLGSMGAVGKILGLPLDIRHITFASAQLGAALYTLKFQVPLSMMFTLVISVVCMGLINLAVSFSLSLFVVTKSRRVRFRQTPELLRLLVERFQRRPADFFLPVEDGPT